MKRNVKNILTYILSISLISSIFSCCIVPNKIFAKENEEWNFGYTGEVQEFTASYSGKYFLETWGASGGGSSKSDGGFGGYTTGYINLKKGTKLYIVCGEQGSVSTENKAALGGFNGGGTGYGGAGSGGGATSITTENKGELKNFVDNQEKIIIVAGAGAGKGSKQDSLPYDQQGHHPIGCGGDTMNDTPYAPIEKLNELGIPHDGNGGLDLSKQNYYVGTVNNIGIGGDSYLLNYGYGGAGGAGYYGGTASFVGLYGGVGGSSYACRNIYDFNTVLNDNNGNGKARISYIGTTETHIVINTNNSCSIENQEGFINKNIQAGETIDLGTPDMYEGFSFVGYELESGDGEIDGTLFTAGVETSVVKVKYSVNLTLTGDLSGELNLNTQKLNLKFEQKDDESKVYRVYQSVDKENWYYAAFAEDVKNGKLPDYVYNFTGSDQVLTLRGNAYLQFYVYGAQGGTDIDGYGGYGGYSYGEKSLQKNTNLYIIVGGTGWGGGHHYNGGADCTESSARGGGGATHIATAPGELKYYGNPTNAAKYVLLVAGGGGANSDGGIGGSGGGYSGGNGSGGTYGGPGATQTSGYSFGLGQPPYSQSAGGGGGWYGGYAVRNDAHYAGSGGGGGSGWIGGVINGSMRNGTKAGNGQAIIRVIDSVETNSFLDDIYVPDKASPNTPSDGKYDSKNDTITVSWNNNGDNGSTYYHQVKSYSSEDTSVLLKESNILENYIETGVKGFYYYIDGVSTGTVTNAHTFVENPEIEVPTAATDRYLHVAAVDGAGNISGTYTMLIPSIAKYTVNHYIQNEDGTYTLIETEEKTGTIGTSVTPETHTQTGRDNPVKQTIIITADGKATVDYYYYVTRFDVTGYVGWNDNNNKYETRPDDIGVTIYKDGEYFDYITVPCPDSSNKYSFSGLQKYDLETGEELVYTVKQDVAYSQAADATSEDKYVTKQNNFNFLNTIRNTDADRPDEPDPDPDKPDDKGFYVEGDIYWEDNDDSLGFRPSETTITLYQKGEDGEWHPYGKPIVVDSKTENHYLFDWLPKYWYDENDVPTAYEYKVEESFTAWYVEDGVIKDAYTIIEDQPNDFDFTNVFNKPDGPIVPVNEYNNTLTIITNTDEKVQIILKPLELFINGDYSVSYGIETGDDILTFVDNTGKTIDRLVSTRYEIVVDSAEYNLEDIKLSLTENMTLDYIDGKWYITIENQSDDALGTLEIELSKKEKFYQDSKKINNYFKVDVITKEASTVKKMSLLIAKPGNPISVLYMDSNTEDLTDYIAGEEVEILDYLGMIPENMEFIGWSTEKDLEAEYLTGDIIKLESSLTLYPVFQQIED